MEKIKTVNKHGYRKPPNGYEIEGMDIQIDENTQKLCETYNQSSGATRGVLYLLLVVTAISVIAVFNSNWKFNWDKERIALFSKNIFKDDSIAKITKDSLNLENSIRVRKDSLNKEKIQYKSSYYKFPSSDSIKRSIKRDFDEQSLNGFIKANIDNNDAVKVSIIGVTIDVNDLASISGITLIMLLVVLRFTVTREKHNLKIAFNSINERYNDGADYFKLRSEYIKNILRSKEPAGFDEEISKEEWKKLLNSKTKEEWDELISDINFIRRRYHYNFLSMNEVFHLPLLDTNKNEIEESWFENQIKKFINVYLFYFFYFIYSYIILNDFCSLNKATAENPFHTVVIVTISLICFFAIFNLCRDTVEHKKIVNSLFNNFWKKNYTYDYEDYSIKRLPLYKVFGIPVLFLLAIFIISKLLTI